MRVVRPDVGDAEPLRQELRELEDLGGEFVHPAREVRVLREVGGHRVEVADHADTGARGGDDGVVGLEDLDKAADQRDRLPLVTGVEVHLPAARLRLGKRDLVAQPL